MDMLAVGSATFPLPLANDGERVRIVGFRSGRDMERKLADLGLCVGSEIIVLSRSHNGPLLIARDAVRVGIDPGVARRVTVVRIVE
jgi:ferrous iron transport protein A